MALKSCLSLKSAVKFFGFLSIVCCLLSAWGSAAELVILAEVDGSKSDSSDGGLMKRFYIALPIYCLNIFVELIQSATSLLLLLAVYKGGQGNRKLILPWLVSTVIVAFYELIMLPNFTHLLAEEALAGLSFRRPIEMMIVRLFTVFMFVDDVCGWLVVFVYYRTLTTTPPNVV